MDWNSRDIHAFINSKMNIVYYLHDETDKNRAEAKILWLKKRFRFISSKELEDFYSRRTQLVNVCHLTIDDGWVSTYKVVFPLLKKYNIPASIFVSPRFCRQTRNFWYMDLPYCDENLLKRELLSRNLFDEKVFAYPLDLILKEIPIDTVYDVIRKSRVGVAERKIVNVEELIEMDKSGLVEIGAHTITHPILALENEERSLHEIKESVTELEELLQHEVRSFAYPNGLRGLDYSEREMNYCKNVGIKLAYSVDPGVISLSNNPLSIPRVGSMKRLCLGVLGTKLPSIQNQAGIRKKIKRHSFSSCAYFK